MKKKPLRIWLIRHARAMEREAYRGRDLDRPLTGKGIERTGRMFKRLAGLRRAPDVVVSSRAARAVQTAELFCKAFSIDGFRRSSRLNPGCRFEDILSVIDALPAGTRHVALVGHEPA